MCQLIFERPLLTDRVLNIEKQCIEHKSNPVDDSSTGTYALFIVFQCELRPLLEDFLDTAEHVLLRVGQRLCDFELADEDVISCSTTDGSLMAPSCSSSLLRVASTT